MTNELERQTNTFLELYKEDYKKVLEAYYFNQFNMDKLIITILFAEISYVTLNWSNLVNALHHVPHVTAYVGIILIIPLISGTCGIGAAIFSYNTANKLLATERERIIIDIQYTLGLNSNTANDDCNAAYIMYKRKIDKLIYISWACVCFTTCSIAVIMVLPLILHMI